MTIDLRLVVLCLADESDGMNHRDIGDMFRQVAAGITLLERRETDHSRASEVITLTMDPLLQ